MNEIIERVASSADATSEQLLVFAYGKDCHPDDARAVIQTASGWRAFAAHLRLDPALTEEPSR